MAWGFKHKRTAEAASALTRQMPPDAYAVPSTPNVIRSWIVEVPEGGIPSRSGDTPGKVKCKVRYIDTAGQLQYQMKDSDGTQLEIDVHNIQTEEYKEGELLVCWQVGGTVLIFGVTGSTFCETLCDCEPYAIANPEVCQNTCDSQANCIYTDGSITYLDFGETTPTPFQFTMRGAPYLDPTVEPTDPGCVWLVDVEDAYGTDGGLARITLAAGGGSTITPPAPYELRTFTGGGDPGNCPIGQISYTSTNGGNGTVMFGTGTVPEPSVASFLIAAHPEVLIKGCRSSDLNALVGRWSEDQIRANAGRIAELLGNALPPNEAADAVIEAKLELERDDG